MKTFMCVLLLAAVVAAEPPRYRQAKYRLAREEGEESGHERESFKSVKEGAPYPASGHAPHKEFRLPARQELAPPSTSYGTPEDSYRAPLYIAPIVEYGVPRGRSFQDKIGEEKEEDGESESLESAEGESEESNSDEESEEKGANKENDEKGERKEKKEKGEKRDRVEKKRKGEKKEKESLEEGSDDDDIISAHGAYYVLLPSSELQRVQFQTENDLAKMAYTARLQYRNEGRAPVYVYGSLPQYQAPAAYTAVAPSYQPAASYSAYSVQQQW